MSAQETVTHAFRQQDSRRTIDLSVRSNPNPRISEWPMPGADTTEALTGCLRRKPYKCVLINVNLTLDKGHYISVLTVLEILPAISSLDEFDFCFNIARTAISVPFKVTSKVTPELSL